MAFVNVLMNLLSIRVDDTREGRFDCIQGRSFLDREGGAFIRAMRKVTQLAAAE